MTNISSALINDLGLSALDEINLIDSMPDPEGYIPGQEDSFDDFDSKRGYDDYDDGYESDFNYDPF